MIEQIGQYKILAELGGGMAVVYRAYNLQLEREEALKKLRPELAENPVTLERFRQEGPTQAKLNHPNIATVYALVDDGPSHCIAMEWVNGTVLRDLMPMACEAALPIALQVLEGLDYAHRHKVLHRDIKPENIIISVEGTAKVLDFGIAHAIGSTRMTKEKSVIGTLEYVSPERIQGREVDGRSDLYSVGIMLFEMIAGRLPFEYGNEYELLRCQVESTPRRLSELVPGTPAFLEDAIQTALQKKPEDRYDSCAAMAQALRDGALENGVKLVSIATALNLRERQPAAPSPSGELRNWITRIRALIERKEFETAERLIDTALNDFPASAQLTEMKSLLPGQSRPAPVDSPELTRVRQLLSELLALEEARRYDEALSLLSKAEGELSGSSSAIALKVAEAHFLRLRAPSAS